MATHSLDDSNLDYVTAELKKDPAANGLVLQDLLRFKQSTQVFFTENPFSYIHISGHPAYAGSKVISMGGESSAAANLLDHVKPQAPFTVRETDSKFTAAVREYYSGAVVYDEYRMDVTREQFKKQHRGIARQIKESDLESLAEFFGAPKQAAPKFMGWIKGARAIFGVFVDNKLVSMGSSFVAIPEIWNLVGIETKPEHRRKGLATEVTSSLVAAAMEETELVTLTVRSDNGPAISTYQKLGFQNAGRRVWIDCGAGTKP